MVKFAELNIGEIFDLWILVIYTIIERFLKIWELVELKFSEFVIGKIAEFKLQWKFSSCRVITTVFLLKTIDITVNGLILEDRVLILILIMCS